MQITEIVITEDKTRTSKIIGPRIAQTAQTVGGNK